MGVNFDKRSREEKVYDALVRLWKEAAKSTPVVAPKLGDVAVSAGVTRSSMSHVLMKLMDTNKVKKIRDGVYVPIIPERQR